MGVGSGQRESEIGSEDEAIEAEARDAKIPEAD